MVCESKKRVALILYGVLLLTVIVSILLFVKITSSDSYWGVTLKSTKVSNEGLTLTLYRKEKDGLSNVYVWEQFVIQKLTIKGWEEVENATYLSDQFLDGSGIQVKDGFTHTWTIRWEEECGKLPMGIYRIAKEVGRVTETQTHYAPFVVVSWWQILLIVLVVLLLAFGIWAGMKYGVSKKVKIVCLIVIAVCGLMLGVYQGIRYHYNHQSGKEMLECLDSWNVKAVGFCYGRNKMQTFTESESEEFFEALNACEIGNEITEDMVGGRYTYIVVRRYIGNDVRVTPNGTVIDVGCGSICESYECDNGGALESFISRFE